MNQHASINRIFRLIWNESRRAWIPAAETARARGKRSVRAAVWLAPILAALGLAQPAHAAGPPPAPSQLPTGGKVVAGAATLASGSVQGTAVLDVNQTSSRAVIDWNTFNVGSAAEVSFNQPSASSATLNRVLDSNPSQIFGKITAPGQVFLANPNGVYFGKSASVEVGGLTATTSSISDADFMAGKIKLSRNGATGSVVNDGTLKASLGGYIALLAPDVRNSGIIIARMGTVVMAAGETITLDIDGRHLAGITAQPSAIAALVENRSAVIAPGGVIILSAKALDSLEGGVVRNSGTLAATGMVAKGGRIELEASTSIENSGTISANAGSDGSSAGQITVAAPSVTNSGSITAVAAPAVQTDVSAASIGGRIAVTATTIEQTDSGIMDVSAPIAGSVALEAVQDIHLSGSILAAGIEVSVPQGAVVPTASDARSVGGSVTLTALHDITLQNALIDVSGDDAAGRIQVQGGSPAPSNPPSDPPTLALLGATDLNASSRRGKGGAVTLTADNVTLLGTTAIDASGATGGGDVYVGGGFHGKDPSIADAQQTTLGSGVEIDANATQAGDGGKVVVWSSDHTDFAGSIRARGGALSGAGGTLEVSGAKLAFTGLVDAGALHGAGGSLLLDPQNITVDSSGTDSLPNETFSTNPSTDSVIAPSAITSVTDTGTAVTLQANNNLTINSSIITSAGGSGGAMTFEAGNSIAVNASVISDNGNISFTANDPGATAADRASGTATFANNSVIDAGSGTVNITMGSFSGTGAASGTIETGHVVAANLDVTQDGPTAGAAAGAIDLGETDLAGNLSISANSDRNVTNTLGAQGTGGEVVVRGTATISVGAGDVTISGPNTDFNIIGFTAGNVTLNDASAVQFATSVISGNLTETTVGPIASTGPVQVTGVTSLTANNGGFGYADPYINLTNASNHFTGAVALDVGTAGYTGTGGYATIRDSGALDIATSTLAAWLTVQAGGDVTLGTTTVGTALTVNVANGAITTGATGASYETLTATGAVSLGATTVGEDLTISTAAPITNTGAIVVNRQTTLTAGSGNDITLDNTGNKFDYMRVISGNNVTLFDQNGIVFGNYASAGGWTSHISGNLSLTAGGDINQIGSSNGNGGYSAIEVDGTTTFTANGASAPINLYLGTYNPWGALGQPNDFVGTITLAANNVNTGFSNVELRNINAGASVLAGLTSVGTLANVYLTLDNAPSVTLPGMSVTGNLYVDAPGVANTASIPANVISQTGSITVGNAATFETASTGDVDLTNTSNNFAKYFGVVQSRNVDVQTSGAIILYASPGYDEHIYGNLTVTAGGNITDAGNRIWVTTGTASFDSGAANVSLTQDNVWSTVAFSTANNVTLNSNRSLILADSTIAGNLYLHCDNGNNTLTQASGTAVTMTSATATATFNNWSNSSGITLANTGNVFGPLAISGSGAVDITENDAITQASAWRNYNGSSVGYAVTLTTTDGQAITLNQSSNYLGALTLTQNGSSSTPGAVVVDNANGNAGITQGGAWTLAGATTLDSYGYSIALRNPNNVLGPLQVLSSAGTTNGVASSIAIYGKNTASTDAISDVGAAGAWTTGSSEVVELVGYDSTGATEGGGNVTLTNPANVLGELYIKGDNVTITENSSIVDGPVLSNWDGAGDGGWATTGSMSLVVANPSSANSIHLSNLDNLIGPIALSTTGTSGTLGSVLITDNEDLTQNGVWNVGTTPVTLDARTHNISLIDTANVMGNIDITTANGTPTSVAITEDAPITQGSAWALTGVPITLATTNDEAITLTQATNIFGNLTITQNGTSGSPGAVDIVENGSITQPTGAGGAWTTAGATTLDPTTGAIVLTNAANVLGPIAIGGTPSAVSISEAGNITQASAWVEGGTPFTLNSGAADIDLTEAGNQLGALTLTGQNATVVEDQAAGITEGTAWNVPGTTTLTAGAANPIVLTANPANNLGTVSIVSASNADIATAGAVNFGASTIFAGGTLTISAGGAITQSGAITAPSLQLIGAGDAALTDTSNDVKTLAAGFSGGDLAFTDSGDLAIGVINGTSGVTIGDHNVTLTSVNGTVTGLTNVNPASASLTVSTGTALTLPQMSIAGAQTYTAGGAGITLTAGVTGTASGAIAFDSPVTLAADLTVQSSNSAITFGSAVTGASYQLGANAGNAASGGTVTFTGAVSGLGQTTDASPALSLSSRAAIFDTTLDANNGLAITGPVTFTDTVTLGDGSAASVFTGLVTLGKAGGMNLSGYNGMSFDDGVLLQNGPAEIDSNNSPLTFQTAGTVAGPYGLTLDSGTAALTGLDRMGSDLTSLTVTALSPTIPSAGISIAGAQTYTPTSGSHITLDGGVTSTAAGPITFDGPVTLTAASTVASANSPVVFASTVDGNSNLTVNAGTGATIFTGAVGGIAPVGSGTGPAIALQGGGAATFDSAVTTRSGVTSVGPVIFDGNVTLGNGDTGSTFGGQVTAGGSSGISISGYDGLAFDGGVALAGGPVSVASNGSTLSFGAPVTGAESLTLDALSAGAGTVAGLDQIGPASDLTGLTVTAQTVSLPSTGLAVAGPMSFTAPGGITLNGAVGSSASPQTGAITFNSPVTLATGPVAVTAGNAPIDFAGAVDGGQALSVDSGTGSTTFGAPVGAAIPLASLNVAGGTAVLDGGSVRTSGAQIFAGPVVLGATTTLTGDGVQFDNTVDGAYGLTINDTGTTTFAAAVGGGIALTGFADNAAAVALNAGAVTTSGAQTFGGAVTLGADTALTGTGITFTGAIDGARGLTANARSGALRLEGTVGGTTAPTQLAATGNTIAVTAVDTTGAQTYTAEGGLTLNGDLTAGAVTLTGPTTLGADVTVSTVSGSGNISFSGSTSTIDGAHGLTLAAGSGNVTLGGVVGGNTRLTAVDISGYDLTLPDIFTVGDANQTYRALDNITLSQSRTLDAPISFTADADNDGNGSFILLNGVSLTATNSALTIQAADINLQGNSTLASGTGLMTLIATDGRNIMVEDSGTTPVAGQMTIIGSGLSRMSSSGGVDLKTTGSGWIDVNGITAADSQNITGTLSLLAQGTGDVSFITAPSTFNAVTVNATGGTANIGVNLTTSNAPIDFVTKAAVSGASTIDSGNAGVTFGNALDVNNNLTVIANSATFDGAVGSNRTLTLNLGAGGVTGLAELQSTLTGLTVNSTSSITLPALTISGPQVYDTGAITATGDLHGTGLTFDNALTVTPTSGGALTLDARTGTLTLASQAAFGANDMTFIGDAIVLEKPITGSGSLVLEPSMASTNIAVGGSGAPIAGLNLTAADMSALPIGTLASITIGSMFGTGTLDVAGPLSFPGTPLALYGAGGIAQSGGSITSGALTLYAAGNPITLTNAANAFGAVAIDGSPSAVSLTDTSGISQLGTASWTLGSAPLTLDADVQDIDLTNTGNTFGTLSLTGRNASVVEAAATNLGPATLTGNLTLTSAGEVTQSGALAIGGNLDVATSVAAGDVTVNNSGASATTLGDTEVGGNYTITATNEPITQAAGTAIQVAGNLTATGSSILLTGAANLVGGTTSLPATSTTELVQAGVITLPSENVTGNLTVISEATSRTFSGSVVSGTAILLDDASNHIGGTISTSASPPAVTNNGYVQTGITQGVGTTISVTGDASFTAESSNAGTLGIDLTNSGNSLGTLLLSGDTVAVKNSTAAVTTIGSAVASTSLALMTAAGVDQTGAITTPSLTVNASGPITLDNANNDVGSIDVTAGGGAVSVVNAGALAVAGIDAGGSAVNLAAGGSGSLTQTGALRNVTALTVNAGGEVLLSNTGNAIQSLSASGAGTGFDLYNGGGALSVTGPVSTAAGDLLLRTTGDLTLATGAVLDAAAGNVAASTEGAGNFINDSSQGGSTLVVGGGDRWLVYSDAPDLVSGAHTVKGGLTSNFRHYGNATYTSYAPGSVTESGDGFIYDYATPALTVNAAITGTPSQVYGDNPTATIGYTISSGLVDSEDDAANVVTGGAATYSMALSNTLNAGGYAVMYTGGLTSNYTLTADPNGATYTVTPAVLTYTANPASRTYGAANPALSGMISGFKLGQDASVLAGTPVWTTPATATSPVGAYAINGSGYTSGGNYMFAQASVDATALTITRASLTVTANNDTVTYDGAGFSGGAGATYSGFVNGDNASVLGGTLAYGGNSQGARNAGTYTLAPAGLTSGNYAITFDNGALTIDKAPLTVTTSNVIRTYDGTLAATGTPIAAGGTQLFGSDTLSGGTYAFTSANAGSADRTVAVSGVTVSDGNGGGNYNVIYASNTTSTIDPASITVSAENVTKTYDGTTAASGVPALVSGTLYHNASNGGVQDGVNGGTYAFTDPNAGSADKTVAMSGVTVSDGNGGGNYDVTYADNTTSTITPAPLTLSATIAERTYDGTTNATVSGYTLSGLVGSQTLDASGASVTFTDANAGTGKAVQISGITLANGTNGGLASDYTVASTAAATGTIDPKLLTVNATVANKVYDGTTVAQVKSYGLSGFVGNQTVDAVYTGSASFADKNVGNAMPVSVTGISLLNGTNGGLASNYAVPATVAATADITPATLHIAGVVAENKVYDGTMTAPLGTQAAVLTGVIGSDDVQVNTLTGTFATKNVGTNLPIGTGTAVLSGPDAGNYTLVQPSGLSASITPRPLAVTAAGIGKVYDGTTAASVTLADDPIAGDSVTVTSTSAFLDKNVGVGKFVSVSDITLGGADAGDYTANSSTSTSASITPATLVVRATGVSKVYDGTTAATVELSGNPLLGDQVSLGDAGATFASADPGNGKAITVDGIYVAGGAEAGDYIVGNTTATTTADVTGTGSTAPPVVSTVADAGEWSLPPAIPQPQPPMAPAPPAALLDVSLPAGFGGSGAASAAEVPNGLPAGAANAGNVAGANGKAAPAEPDKLIIVDVARTNALLRGLVTVSVPEGLIERGMQFRVPLPADLGKAAEHGAVKVTRLNGRKLPSWLHYLADERTFIATETPKNALPLEVLVRIGAQSWVVFITERYPM